MKAKYNLLPYFRATETHKINPHLIRLFFETRKKEHDNPCKLGGSLCSMEQWHSFLKYYLKWHIVLEPSKKSKEVREVFTLRA